MKSEGGNSGSFGEAESKTTATGPVALQLGDSQATARGRMPCNRFLSDFCLLLEGSEDGIEFAGAEGAEDLGFEVTQGRGAFGESGNCFLAGGFGEDDAVVLAHGPEEFDNADAEFAGHFLGGGGPFDRIHDVADSLVGVLKQQDVTSHHARSFLGKLEFSHKRRLECNLFQMGIICRVNVVQSRRKDRCLQHIRYECTSNHCGWWVESDGYLCFSA